MKDRDEKRGGGGCLLGLVLALPLLPVLYVLGLGPAVWIAGHFRATRNFFAVFYHPLQVVHDNFGNVLLFGMFRQEVRNGWQVESPDNWLRSPDP